MSNKHKHPLAVLRDARNLTLRQIADATGLDTSWLSRVERGAIPDPSHRKIVILARYFNVETDVIFPVPQAKGRAA